MKKLLYLFLCFTLFISGVQAQNCSDVTATAAATPSTCMSNGSITITWSGASIGNLVEKQYSLKSTTGSLAIGPVSGNVFNNLPPGTYNLEAAAFCGSLSGAEIVRTINNVVVTGSYKEPRLTFVAASATSSAAAPTSRNSYADCALGLIAVFLEDGNQTSMPTFTITSAPAGVVVPQVVTATKATAAIGGTGWRYMLDKTWPAGTYSVSANDGCYSAATSFEIKKLTTVPSGISSMSNFLPYNPGVPDCSKVYYRPNYSYSATTDLDYYRYYNDGLYEYGVAPLNEEPKPENWFTIRYFGGANGAFMDIIDLGPKVYSDYYSNTNNLTVYTRVKSCPTAKTSINTYFRTPSFSMSSSTNTCTGSRTYTINKYSDYDGILCYPLTFTITDRATGALIYEKNDYMSTDGAFVYTCDPGQTYYRNLTDASGYKLQNNYPIEGSTPSSSRPTFSISSYASYPEYYNCDSYKIYYSTSNGTPCAGESAFPCYVTIADGTGAIIKSDTLTNTSSRLIDNLQYGIAYKITYVYPNWPAYSASVSSNIARSTVIPSNFILSKNTTDNCADNIGILRISTPNSYQYFKAGATITITGPAGYIGQSYTYPTNPTSSGYYRNFASTYLPPGQYTATIEMCGETYTTSATIAAGYKGEKIGYTLEQDCMGTKLFPSGSISLNGVTQNLAYFRMTTAPAGSGADTKVIVNTNTSDYFRLTTAGTYILGMMSSNSIGGCAIKYDTIYHNPKPLALDRDKTSAYSCPGGSTGYLTLQATNGVLPYTYSVYNEANTILLHGPETSYDAIDLGSFGEANKTYTVRMSDFCGNSFNQQVTLVSLDRTALAYGQELVCYDSSISIFGFTVTNATYSWTGPNGYTSTGKNPIIPNATPANGGWYKVEINSQPCGIIVKDSIFIRVYDPVVPNELNGKTQEVTLCPYQTLTIGQAATGGSGKISYQWEYNANTLGTGAWNIIAGETKSILTTNAVNYIFTSTTSSPPRRYLRLKVVDEDCGTYYLFYHTNVQGCMFLINPDLKSPGSEN